MGEFGPRGMDEEESGLGLVILDGGDGPALRISDERARELVAFAVEQARARAPSRRALSRRLWPPRGIGRWQRGVGLSLGVLVASTAAAAAYRGEWPARWFGASEPAPSAQAGGSESRQAPSSALRAHELPMESSPPPTAPLKVAEVPAPQGPAVGGAASSPATPVARTQAVTPPRNRTPVRSSPPRRDEAAAVTARIAADGLERANTLRRERRYAGALAAYRAVIEAHPTSHPAQAARVAAAALELERFGNARAAERLYAEAMERGTVLLEEARFGLAESYRALGDEPRERAALRAFLSAHPESPLAPAARRRLSTLVAR